MLRRLSTILLFCTFLSAAQAVANEATFSCTVALGEVTTTAELHQIVSEHAKDFARHFDGQGVPRKTQFEVMLALASQLPAKNWVGRISKLQLTQAQRSQLARRAADKDLASFLEVAPKFGLDSGELGRLLIGRFRYGNMKLLAHVPKLGLNSKDASALYLSAFHGAYRTNGGEELPEVYKAIAQTELSAPDRERLAEQMILTGTHWGQHIGAFRLSEGGQYRIALKMLESPREDHNAEHGNYTQFAAFLGASTLSAKRRMELLERMVERYPSFSLETIGKLKLTDAERITLLRRGVLRHLGEEYSPEADGLAQYHAKALTFSSPKYNYEVWLKIAQEARVHWSPQHFFEQLKTVPLTDKQRLEILKAMLARVQMFGSNFQLSMLGAETLTTQQARFDLLQAFFDRMGEEQFQHLDQHGKKLGVDEYLKLIPRHRSRALRLLIGRGQEVAGSPALKDLTRAEQMEILSEQATSPAGAESVAKFVGELNLTYAQRLELARKVALSNPRALNAHIANFRLSPQHREELAITAMSATAPDFAFEWGEQFAKIANYALGSSEARYRVAMAHLAHHPIAENIPTIVRLFNLTPTQAKRLERVPFSINPEPYLDQLKPGLSGTTLNDAPEAIAELQAQLKIYARANPEVLPADWIKLPWDRVKKRETGLRLLTALYRHTGYDLNKPIPQDSVDLFGESVGLPLTREVADGMSASRLGTLYELGLDVSNQLSKPPFLANDFDATLLGPKHADELAGFLHRVRDLLHLSGNNDGGWAHVREVVRLGERRVTPENIRAINQELEQLVVDGIQQAFRGTDVELTYDQLMQLKEKWGSIEPVLTLIARYQGNPAWKAEIPILGKIFEKTLRGEFEIYKFQGDSDDHDRQQAAKQLAVLKTPAQVAAWKKSRQRVELVASGAAAISADSRLTAAKKVVTDNLIPNANLGTVSLLVTEHSAISEALKKHGNPTDILRALREGPLKGVEGTAVRDKVLSSVGRMISETNDPAEAKWYAQALRLWAKDLDVGQQTRTDVQDIYDKLNPPPERGGERPRVVFTTTLIDPKSLLTIGDLVQASSCQNYRTGSVIQTLPGYVVDANAIGLASFSVDSSHFQRAREFDRLRQALERNLPIKAVFDGGKRTITFSFQDGEQVSVTTRPLEHAFRRHILKLGEAAGGVPGVKQEPAYEQIHPTSEIMARHAQEIVDEVNRDIGGVSTGPIRVVGSRNPGGIYSDLGGGVRTDDYTIP